jgi:5-formyltetrahydrofolate cyclo-ligase
MKHEIFKQSEHIACYFSINHEFDSSYIMKSIFEQNKICYLPVLMEGNFLCFIRHNKGDALQKNRYAIPEPVDKTNVIAKEMLDLVITPLIAFDLLGHRLGAGGGFYDRTFQFLRSNPLKKPKLLGLGFNAQQAEMIPTEDWDIKLDGVLTEKNIFIFDST